MSFNIAIDGPAGAGKSTIAKQLAKELSFIYVDTGAMYRSMALYFMRNDIAKEDEAAISDACKTVEVSIAYENGEQQVLLNGENVSKEIRKEEVGKWHLPPVFIRKSAKNWLNYSRSLQQIKMLSWMEEISEPVCCRMPR